MELFDKVTSGDKSDIRPEADTPWTGSDDVIQIIKVTVSEDPEEPTYVESVTVATLENVDELEIRKVKTLGGPEEIIERDEVRFVYI